jgi:hypothetical protein
MSFVVLDLMYAPQIAFSPRHQSKIEKIVPQLGENYDDEKDGCTGCGTLRWRKHANSCFRR